MSDSFGLGILLLCRDAKGDRDFFQCSASVTPDEYMAGKHLEAAEEAALLHGHTGPFTAVDSRMLPQLELLELAAVFGPRRLFYVSGYVSGGESSEVRHYTRHYLAEDEESARQALIRQLAFEEGDSDPGQSSPEITLTGSGLVVDEVFEVK